MQLIRWFPGLFRLVLYIVLVFIAIVCSVVWLGFGFKASRQLWHDMTAGIFGLIFTEDAE